MRNAVSLMRVLNFLALISSIFIVLIMLFLLPSFTLSGDVKHRLQLIENAPDLESAKQVSVSVLKGYAASQRSSNGIFMVLFLIILTSIPLFLSNWFLSRKIEKSLYPDDKIV